ncbi:hypothetical protein Cni_G07551 [Canna indica]|uniref:Uncharacterized protein n=1 Tax=Canna indica TaxID=4628 RepID=A0AAQ3JYP0_9LILI|nr:hypothetical protein Cni_G07551 [Canna indica]
MYRETRTLRGKKGYVHVNAAQFMANAEQTINERLKMTPTIERVQLENEVYREIAGPEQYSRVRLHGLGVKPSQIFGQQRPYMTPSQKARIEEYQRHTEAQIAEINQKHAAEMREMQERLARCQQLLQQPRESTSPPSASASLRSLRSDTSTFHDSHKSSQATLMAFEIVRALQEQVSQQNDTHQHKIYRNRSTSQSSKTQDGNTNTSATSTKLMLMMDDQL